MRVIVCGGRDYSDAATVSAVLGAIHKRKPLSLLVHGGATGADALAARWALANGVPCVEFPANWREHGKAAGPMRNARMVRESGARLVLAFPGGRGTADMVARATRAGFQVGEVCEHKVAGVGVIRFAEPLVLE